QSARAVEVVRPDSSARLELLREVTLRIVGVPRDPARVARLQELAGLAVLAIAPVGRAKQITDGIGQPQIDVTVGMGGRRQVSESVVLVVDRSGERVRYSFETLARLPRVLPGRDVSLAAEDLLLHRPAERIALPLRANASGQCPLQL